MLTMKPLFPTRMEEILERIDAIDPVKYARPGIISTGRSPTFRRIFPAG